MSNSDIFQAFKSMFPQFVNDMRAWYSSARKNSIRICMFSGQELLFTYNSKVSWELKTKLLGGKNDG